MSDFGDIRSTVHAQDMYALHDAMRQYRDPSTPVDVVARYAIDAALKYEWSLPLMYGDHYWHPLEGEAYQRKMVCHIWLGDRGYHLGKFPVEEMRRWLLEWVVKPMRMWCVDEPTHAMWGHVEAFHVRYMGSASTCESNLWSSAMRMFSNAYGDDNQYVHVAHSVDDNNPTSVCHGLQMAMNEHSERSWQTMGLLRNSLDLWALRYFLNPTP